MPETYSLVGRPWLPVALVNGQREYVRLCDVTRPDIIRLDTGRPDCDISLTEFLIGLLAVAMGPKDRRDWKNRYKDPPTLAELDAVLQPFGPAMTLDGDGERFFQDREVLVGTATPVAALFMDAPAEHFQVEGRIVVLSRAGAALALATLQTSAPAGGAGHRTSLRGGGPLTTLVVPGTRDSIEPTLWQRLWANIPTGFRADVTDIATIGQVFPWMAATRISGKGGLTTTPDNVHAGQVFFGMPRRIRLIFQDNPQGRPCDLTGHVDDVIVTSYVTKPGGANYTAWSRAHPLSPYYRVHESDPEFLPVHLKSSRVGYRQWLGIVMEAQTGLRVPARCLLEFRERAEDLEDFEPQVITGARLLVAGYAMDNMKPLDFAESLLPLVMTNDPEVSEAVRTLAHNWVQAADTAANQLVSAVKLALFGESSKVDRDSTLLEAVKSRFWADTEEDFYDQLRAGTETFEQFTGDLADGKNTISQTSGGTWLKTLSRHVLAIFDDAVPIENAESGRIKDVIAGRRMLGLLFSGYGKGGQALFALLNQQSPEPRLKGIKISK